MKNDSTTTFLNIVLAAFVFLGVAFALLDMWRTHDLRQLQTTLQTRMQRAQITNARAQALLNDAIAFNANAKIPELNQIIQGAQAPAPVPAK